MPDGGATSPTAGLLARRRGNWPDGHLASHSRRLYRTFERSNTKGAKVVAGLAVNFPSLIMRAPNLKIKLWPVEF